MRSSILARIPGFRQRIIPEPHVPSRGLQARGTGLMSLIVINYTATTADSTVNNYTTNLEIKGYSSYFQDGRLIVFKAIGRPPETFSIIQCSRFYNIQLGYKLFTVWYPKPNCSILWISGYCKFQTLKFI